MWREAVLAALALNLSQGSQIPIGVKSHMLGLYIGTTQLQQGHPPISHTYTYTYSVWEPALFLSNATRQYQPIQRGFETGMPP